jgi:hypothetical protein
MLEAAGVSLIVAAGTGRGKEETSLTAS